MTDKFTNSRHFPVGEVKDLLRLRTYLLEHCSQMGMPFDIKDEYGILRGQRTPYEFGISFKVDLDTYDDGYTVTTVEGDNYELAMILSDKLEDILVPIPEERRKILGNKEGYLDNYLTQL